MKVTIKNQDILREFDNSAVIFIGSDESCDFVVDNTGEDVLVKLIYSEKYNNYVIINSSGSKNVLCNGKSFTKALVPPYFSLQIGENTILITLDSVQKALRSAELLEKNANRAIDIFNGQTEQNRIAIVKEIGNKIEELKASVKSLNLQTIFMDIALILLSIACSFGMTNFLLGLRVNATSSVLNITTNFGFLVCLSIIVASVGIIMKIGVYSLVEFNKTKRLGDSAIAQKFIIFIASIFLFMVYVINLFYYKDLPGFNAAALFIAILLAGGLTTVSIAGGYFKSKLKDEVRELTNSEFREDFESILKQYRNLIEKYVNSLSENRITSVKSHLLNNQMRMIVETAIGLLTAPFLAYGVSNTLASCFPEAANWVRISGLRFSPIFLTLSTFLIIFAFLVFVTAFSIAKQIKSSEIIKFDGFHDYNSHGVSILGVDATKNLNKERITLLFIACSIILIEFTMNVSYFVSELGGDISGIFLSIVTALVPTALLIAETNLLSNTMHKIHNYNELLAMLD